MKKTAAWILLLILLVPFACSFTHTDEFYVNDYAGVLTESQEASILAAARELASQTKAQVVVLTVQSLDGTSIEEYAIDIAEDWGIGDKKEDNGVLILLSTGDREIRVEVGYGLEGCLPDAKTGRLIDTYAIPYYQKDDFANGTEQLFYAVLNTVRAEYGLSSVSVPDANEANKYAQAPLPQEELGLYETIAPLVALLLLVGLAIVTKGRIFLWIGFGGRGRGGRGGGFGGGYGGGRSSGGGGSFGGGGASRRF